MKYGKNHEGHFIEQYRRNMLWVDMSLLEH